MLIQLVMASCRPFEICQLRQGCQLDVVCQQTVQLELAQQNPPCVSVMPA